MKARIMQLDVNSKAEAERYVAVMENELANFKWQEQNVFYGATYEAFGA